MKGCADNRLDIGVNSLQQIGRGTAGWMSRDQLSRVKGELHPDIENMSFGIVISWQSNGAASYDWP